MVAVTETESQELGGASATVAVLLGRACVARWREVGPAGRQAGVVCVRVVCLRAPGPGVEGWQP